MNTRLSRTKIARYVADELAQGNTGVVRELAGYLIESQEQKNVDMYIRSILEQCEVNGTVVADVTTATQLDHNIREEISALTGARELSLREHVDPDVIGGIRIQTPTRVLDATVAQRISKLRERKI